MYELIKIHVTIFHCFPKEFSLSFEKKEKIVYNWQSKLDLGGERYAICKWCYNSIWKENFI